MPSTKKVYLEADNSINPKVCGLHVIGCLISNCASDFFWGDHCCWVVRVVLLSIMSLTECIFWLEAQRPLSMCSAHEARSRRRLQHSTSAPTSNILMPCLLVVLLQRFLTPYCPVLLGTRTMEHAGNGVPSSLEANGKDSALEVTCFTELLDDATLYFQIIRLQKQIYIWVGCNSAKFGHLYAAATTRLNHTVSVSSILGGASDNTGSSIARRLALRTGMNVILACNLPKNNPMIEAGAEKKLMEKLINLGYTKPR